MRNWAHSGVCPDNLFDANYNSIILNEFIRPTEPKLQLYARRHPELHPSQVFDQMCRGVCSGAALSQDERVDALLSAFGSRFETFNGLEAVMTSQLILSMFIQSDLGALRARAVTHEGFWRGWYSLLRRIHAGEAKGSTENPAPQSTMLRPLTAMQGIAYTIPPASRYQLVCTCVQAGLLDVLEEIIDGLMELNRTEFIQHNMDVSGMQLRGWPSDVIHA